MYQFHQEQHFHALKLAQQDVLKQSYSWVMTSPNEEAFVKLPNERILYTSPPRVSLQLSPPTSIAGADPFSVKSDAGVVYITTQRVGLPNVVAENSLILIQIVYLPAAPTPEFKSFSSPILNLQDTHVQAPFFGANYWVALCRPVPGGGIPPSVPAVELRVTFRDGGAFDFHTMFEQIKERLHQAREAREASGSTQGSELANVHLEQLPAYEPAQEEDEGPTILSPMPRRPTGDIVGARPPSPPPPQTFAARPTPDEPPPGYEQAVGDDLEARLRAAAVRQQDETP